MSLRTRARVFTLLLVVALAATACGSDDPAVDTDETEAPDQEAETGTDVGVEVTGATDEKPRISVPEGDPPGELVAMDLVVGDGAEAMPSSTVTTHYVGVSWSTGEQFDASWDHPSGPATFPLNGVISGWSEGIPGMREGGRRLLVIPPEMAYGSSPPPASGIAADETLVFVVDLVAVQQ